MYTTQKFCLFTDSEVYPTINFINLPRNKIINFAVAKNRVLLQQVHSLINVAKTFALFAEKLVLRQLSYPMFLYI